MAWTEFRIVNVDGEAVCGLGPEREGEDRDRIVAAYDADFSSGAPHRLQRRVHRRGFRKTSDWADVNGDSRA